MYTDSLSGPIMVDFLGKGVSIKLADRTGIYITVQKWVNGDFQGLCGNNDGDPESKYFRKRLFNSSY